jgi:hypothetical protein
MSARPRCPVPRVSSGQPCGRDVEAGRADCGQHGDVDASRICEGLAGVGRAQSPCRSWPVNGTRFCRAHADQAPRAPALARVTEAAPPPVLQGAPPPALAARLAELVHDEAALRAALGFLEEQQRRPDGRGSRMIWHLDRAGHVRAVEITASVYQATS